MSYVWCRQSISIPAGEQKLSLLKRKSLVSHDLQPIVIHRGQTNLVGEESRSRLSLLSYSISDRFGLSVCGSFAVYVSWVIYRTKRREPIPNEIFPLIGRNESHQDKSWVKSYTFDSLRFFFLLLSLCTILKYSHQTVFRWNLWMMLYIHRSIQWQRTRWHPLPSDSVTITASIFIEALFLCIRPILEKKIVKSKSSLSWSRTVVSTHIYG